MLMTRSPPLRAMPSRSVTATATGTRWIADRVVEQRVAVADRVLARCRVVAETRRSAEPVASVKVFCVLTGGEHKAADSIVNTPSGETNVIAASLGGGREPRPPAWSRPPAPTRAEPCLEHPSYRDRPVANDDAGRRQSANRNHQSGRRQVAIAVLDCIGQVSASPPSPVS